MLRAVFLGSRNAFTNLLVHWLSQRVELAGVVWIPSWQETVAWRLQFAQERLRRYGPLKTLDEMVFFAYFNTFLKNKGQTAALKLIYEPYWAVHGLPTWRGDSITSRDVNAAEVVAFLRERHPDVAFAMCTYSRFEKAIRSIPRHGIFVWHEGITPEYLGLYSPFWAVHNLDFERIGYTLLRMDDGLDTGEVYVQGRAVGADPFVYPHSYLGHSAIVDSFPGVERFLVELESGTARPIRRPGAIRNYYTLPGFTDYLRQQVRLRRHRRKVPAGGTGS